MRSKTLAVLSVLLACGLAAAASTEPQTAFDEIYGHYEKIRLALLNDTTEGVEEHSAAIQRAADTLSEEFSTERAGVSTDDAAACEELLPEISATAANLAAADEIGRLRELFYEVSKPVSRYRKLAGTGGTIVAYCPMVKKAWVQPEGDLGNPYMGQQMPRCGTVIAD